MQFIRKGILYNITQMCQLNLEYVIYSSILYMPIQNSSPIEFNEFYSQRS